MTHRLKWLMVIASASVPLVSGCKEDRATQLVGSWKADVGLGSMTMTFSEDGTWVQTVAGMVAGSGQRVWTIEGARLFTTHSSSLDKASIGKEEQLKIITLNDSVLII